MEQNRLLQMVKDKLLSQGLTDVQFRASEGRKPVLYCHSKRVLAKRRPGVYKKSDQTGPQLWRIVVEEIYPVSAWQGRLYFRDAEKKLNFVGHFTETGRTREEAEKLALDLLWDERLTAADVTPWFEFDEPVVVSRGMAEGELCDAHGVLVVEDTDNELEEVEVGPENGSGWEG